MNLDLDLAQHQLVDAVRSSAAVTPTAASGWQVFDKIGLTGLLTSTIDGRPGVGLFEWCLILEELGADCRSLSEIRSVRTFLDVFVHGRTAAPSAAEAFVTWTRQGESASAAPLVTWRPTNTGELVVTPDGAAEPAIPLHEMTLGKYEADRIVDRDLLACGAYALGVGRRCLDLAHDRARKRVIAGLRLTEHQGVSHRLAEAAVELSVARIGIWRTAAREDAGSPAGYLAPAAAAGCVTAVLNCAHTAVQIFGAAGTSDPEIVGLYRAAYGIPGVCGSAQSLWQRAGSRCVMQHTTPDKQSGSAHELVDAWQLPPAIGFSPAVVAAPGRHVFLGGQAAQGPDGQIVGTTITAQFDLAVTNMLTALHAAGGAPQDVVSILIYVTDIQEYRNASHEIAPVYRRHFGRHYPAITTLGVAQLFDENALIELVGTAVIPDSAGSAGTSGT